MLFIAVVITIGALRSDPARNPPPPAYPPAACQAFAHLSDAADHLAAAVVALAGGQHDMLARERAAGEAAVSAANAAIRDLPPWPPGESFDELLASLIIIVVPALDELGAGGSASRDEVARQSEVASQLVAEGRAALDEERYGFGCPG